VPLFFFEIRGGDTGREIRARRNKSSAAGEARSDANKISKMTMNIFRCLSYEHVNDKRSSRYSDSVFPSRAPASCARAHFPSFVFGCLVLLLFARAREREREERKRGKEREPTMMNKLYQHEFATLNESVVSLSRSARSLISSYFSLSESSRIFFLRSSRLAFRPKISTMMITKFEEVPNSSD